MSFSTGVAFVAAMSAARTAGDGWGVGHPLAQGEAAVLLAMVAASALIGLLFGRAVWKGRNDGVLGAIVGFCAFATAFLALLLLLLFALLLTTALGFR